ncbi:unnamed protein product [Auanema sp. JU1783]|nr:unnamed protein product [Auanema sp. JU1783]
MLRLLPQSVRLGVRSFSSASPLTSELKTKIDNIVKTDDVVVFMKGTQKEPMCGFSRNVKLVLDYHEVKFRDFNVLEDAELREGIKTYSEWPTIPQVYVKGEFVGGCDILVQMHKEGEISDFFDGKKIPNKYGNIQ